MRKGLLLLCALLLGACTLSKPISLGLKERQMFFSGLEELTAEQFPETLAEVAQQYPETFWGQRAKVIQALFEKQAKQSRQILMQKRQLDKSKAETDLLRDQIAKGEALNQQLRQLIIEMELQRP